MVNHLARYPSIPRLAAWLFAWGCLLVCATSNAQQPVYWNQHDLEVPYRWTGSLNGVTSVVLYYSPDQGQTWKQAGVGLPQVRSFRFRAPSDGEYWFAIRSFNQFGQASPPGPYAPQMRVVIDTAKPQVARLEAKPDGLLLRINLQANDPTGMAADNVQVYAKAAGRPGWMPATVTAADRSSDGRTLTAEAEWRPPADATQIELRAILTDSAGNQIEKTAVASMPSTGRTTLTADTGIAAAPSSSPAVSRGAIDPFAAAEARFANAAPPATQMIHQPAKPKRKTPSASTWPVDRNIPKPLANLPSKSSGGTFRSAGFDTFSSQDDFFSSRPTVAAANRLVNATDFEFDYELEETGRWGVGKVELWVTQDDGDSWRRLAVDSDRQSPIHVSVPGEGEYGFRLVVEPIGGLGAPTPRPGDRPEAKIEVDLQSPQAALIEARQGEGYFADQLNIRWRVDDKNLTERPIDLFYSNRPTGPWIPIATSQLNTGKHSWRLQRHLPSRPYLKLEAHDRAGNTATVISRESIEIVVPSASGALRGVRPSGG